MNHTEAAQYIIATLTAFGPGEAISMTKETWANIHEAMQVLAQPEQEAVAECVDDGEGGIYYRTIKKHIGLLYTPPPQRTWVGLTGFEQKELMAMSARDAVFATEDKLRRKNT